MTDTEESVSLVRTIKAAPQKVFAAWVDGAQLQRWLAPIAQADGRPGGHFRLEAHSAWVEALKQLHSLLAAS